MAELSIQLLGPFRVSVQGVAVEERNWSRKKAKVLVKLLALAPNRQLHREQIIEILWPETEIDQALGNLHTTVHAARRALEPSLAAGQASRFLQTLDARILLQGDAIFIDAVEFETAASLALNSGDAAAMEAALRLYTGDLLEEDRYEDWASLRREQLSLLHQRLLDRLAATFEIDGHPRQAIDLLNRLIALSPSNEDAHRRLMRLYAATGERHLALRQFRICTETLKQELGAEPEPATLKLQEQVLAGALESKPSEPQPSTAPATALPASLPRPIGRNVPILLGVTVLALLLAIALFFWRYPVYRSLRKIDSLAVLPLVSVGQSTDTPYLSDGITESLINGISQLPGVRVMALSTISRYKDRTIDARKVGAELNVRAVLTGTVMQQGQNVIVNAELVDAEDGSRLWGHRYTAPAVDLTSLEQSLGPEVAVALQGQLKPGQRDRLEKRSTEDPQAYRLYLQARHQANRRSPEGLHKAIEYFLQAIQQDPGYAQAYAGLADAYGLIAFRDESPAECVPKARAAAQKALKLDEQLAEAHTSLAMIHALYDWNWPEAEKEFRRAIALNPGYATAHHWYGVNLANVGQFDHAKAELANALELDPLSAIITLNMGYPAFFTHRYAEAETQFRKALELDPSNPVVHDDLMSLYAVQGKLLESVREGLQSLRISGETAKADRIEQELARRGPRAAFREWVTISESQSSQTFVSPADLAMLSLRAGDTDRAVQFLDLAFQQRTAQLVYLKVDPTYDVLRSNPRFQDMLKRIAPN